MSTIEADTRIRRKQNLLDAEVEGEIVALDIEGGDCYGFNQVASEIWDLLKDDTSINEICRSMMQDFDVSEDQCRSGVEALIRRLESDGLVVSIN